MYIARDRDGSLWIYDLYPILKQDVFFPSDQGGQDPIECDKNLFPKLTFENSPMEVELKIKV